ncbi:hypothetical protein SAMN05421595_2280 [Austwickia chelonae]|uniref:Uncharacterized protein n=1 Tax=Austwickia chelonae NBRC 105200 TaxID=1184607 RepID=K6V8T2_9MICO|nr:hypothetical protein [Austwickia chelonae]GAB78628.1 hypothetical protein AUCHE_16_00450 [Austwickia chelonae NBRC 105200]SEW34230.1 hypothetical protein SAMN05421595_2280 [Austwickia chelonae]
MKTQFAVAPHAPGGLGEDVEPQELMSYIKQLGEWIERRRGELDALDEASMHVAERDAHTGDVLLSMTLWKAVSDRHDLLTGSWDSGRLLEQDRRRLTTLIWGSLDMSSSSGSALSVSLPEACRLSDSLASSLRGRLRLEGSEPDVDNRLRSLRASVERIRDQIGLVPVAARPGVQAVYDALLERTTEVCDRARRGADVGGLLPALESDAALAERDLIVGAARRTEMKHDLTRAAQVRDELASRSEAVQRLAVACVSQVAPAPRLAVPDPQALGDPPTRPEDVKGYLSRLELVSRALEQCQRSYAGALERRDALLSRLSACRQEVASWPEGPMAEDACHLQDRAEEVAQALPVELVRLASLVVACEAHVAAAAPTSGRGEPRR